MMQVVGCSVAGRGAAKVDGWTEVKIFVNKAGIPADVTGVMCHQLSSRRRNHARAGRFRRAWYPFVATILMAVVSTTAVLSPSILAAPGPLAAAPGSAAGELEAVSSDSVPVPGASDRSLEWARFDLIRPADAPQTGGSSVTEYLVRLPGHIKFRAGSELTLVLGRSPQFLPDPASMTITVNGRALATVGRNITTQETSQEPATRLRVVVPEQVLVAGWNTIALQFAPGMADADGPRKPLPVTRTDFQLTVAYERLPLLPELGRFPATLAEERLLHRELVGADGEAQAPTVSVLLPVAKRDVHLRALAVLGARFGQLEYLANDDCRVSLIKDGPKRIETGNGVIVARRDELDHLSPSAVVPVSILNQLLALKPGQGLIHEFILGAPPRQRRWILVSGADDAGLEKAILTLGSAPALSAVPPGPAVIGDMPAIAAAGSPETVAPEAKVGGLTHFNRLLVRDQSLRRAALLLPMNASLAEVQWLFKLAMHLGRQLPAATMLWPEACAYAPGVLPPPARLENRSVLLLGSVAQWNDALPTGVRAAMETEVARPGVVRIQGRDYALGSFEPTLALAQTLRSPWSKNDWLVAAGGWHGFAIDSLKRMFTDPESSANLTGHLCALDGAGRTASYDLRSSTESFAERLHRMVPPGVSAGETQRQLDAQMERAFLSTRVNQLIFLSVGALLLTLIGARLVLSWDRARRRQRALRNEAPLGVTS